MCGGEGVCVQVRGRELGVVCGMVKWHRRLKSTYQHFLQEEFVV